MNSAISNLRPYGSQIVKLILFFYSDGAFFFWSFSFPCLSSLSLILALSFQPFLSLSLSLTKPRPQHQAKSIFIAMVFFFFFFFFFLVCDLMVDSAVVVWIMDLAFWVISRPGFQFGHILVGL